MEPVPIMLNIGEMIDQAIGTPEVGVVDFNMLQAVLHCIAQQMRILNKNVELKGTAAAFPAGTDQSKVQTINIHEFTVDTGEGFKEIPANAPPPKDPEDSILVVERVKKIGSSSSEEGEAYGKPTVITPRKSLTTTDEQKSTSVKVSVVTVSKFNLLKDTVDDLKHRVYGTSPSNQEIMDDVRSQTNIKAITDMWNRLNVQSRLEAAESGIAKLSSLLQEVMSSKNREASGKGSTVVASMKQSVSGPSSLKTKHHTISSRASEEFETEKKRGTPTNVEEVSRDKEDDYTSGVSPAAAAAVLGVYEGGAPPTIMKLAAFSASAAPEDGFSDMSNSDLDGITRNVKHLRLDLDNLYVAFFRTMDSAGIAPNVSLDKPPSPALARSMAIAAQEIEKEFEAGTTSPNSETGGGGGGGGGGGSGSDGSIGGGGGGGGGRAGGGGSGGGGFATEDYHSEIAANTENKMSILDSKIKKCFETIENVDTDVNEKLTEIGGQINAIVNKIKTLSTNIEHAAAANTGSTVPAKMAKDIQALMQLFTIVQHMQAQLKNVNETAVKLVADKEDKQHHIKTLVDQVEMLKVVKLDREDMAEAMAEKADLQMLSRKVSHDQFEIACDDLAKGLEQAIGKLNVQEALWQQALDDIQREIETKLDKIELSPVKNFFNNKLKQLQENLKQLAALRREVEAAGTKRRLLKDVNCISCDAAVVMSMDPSPIMTSKPLPANLSMKPYLCYELDNIRKMQAAGFHQRNMHDWETIDKQMAQPKPLHKVRSDTDKHICNRYCGGSHTVTTPAQRVARTGHFAKQWGPDVVPLTSGLAPGDDGKMYKVTNVPTKNGQEAVDTCITKAQSARRPNDKPLTKTGVGNECRCLDTGRSPAQGK